MEFLHWMMHMSQNVPNLSLRNMLKPQSFRGTRLRTPIRSPRVIFAPPRHFLVCPPFPHYCFFKSPLDSLAKSQGEKTKQYSRRSSAPLRSYVPKGQIRPLKGKPVWARSRLAE